MLTGEQERAFDSRGSVVVIESLCAATACSIPSRVARTMYTVCFVLVDGYSSR
jgi:hypothetical protein